MLSKPILALDDVQLLLAAARKAADQWGWKVSIAVVDDGGHPLGLMRLDQASAFTAHMALAKARTAAMGKRESRHYEEMILTNKVSFLSAPQLEGMVEGGVPIVVEGYCVGAVGVSGVKSGEDAQIARAAIDALLARVAAAGAQ